MIMFMSVFCNSQYIQYVTNERGRKFVYTKTEDEMPTVHSLTIINPKLLQKISTLIVRVEKRKRRTFLSSGHSGNNQEKLLLRPHHR